MNPSTTSAPVYGLAHNLIGFPSSTLRVRIDRYDARYAWVRTADLLDAGTPLVIDLENLESADLIAVAEANIQTQRAILAHIDNLEALASGASLLASVDHLREVESKVLAVLEAAFATLYPLAASTSAPSDPSDTRAPFVRIA